MWREMRQLKWYMKFVTALQENQSSWHADFRHVDRGHVSKRLLGLVSSRAIISETRLKIISKHNHDTSVFYLQHEDRSAHIREKTAKEFYNSLGEETAAVFYSSISSELSFYPRGNGLFCLEFL